MDRDYLIDLVLSIAQDAADEWHIKEALSGLETEIGEVNREEMPELYEKLAREIAALKEDYVEGARLRRYKTDILGIKSPNYDYHKRCTFKHRATAFVLATEVYLADPDDLNYKIMVESEKRFWKAVCQLMGVEEITDCGRCLSDQLSLVHSSEKLARRGLSAHKLEEE